VFGDVIADRFVLAGLMDTSRLAVYRRVVVSILDRPFLGFGYGTFADVFPMYRDQSVGDGFFWEKAHNAYLEIWQGLGLVCGTALIVSLIWLIAKCCVGAINRRRDAQPAIVASSAGVLVGLHALVDFSLQIEAVSLTLMALLGAGVAQSQSSRSATGE
jgi:O-antigen ligase